MVKTKIPEDIQEKANTIIVILIALHLMSIKASRNFHQF